MQREKAIAGNSHIGIGIEMRSQMRTDSRLSDPWECLCAYTAATRRRHGGEKETLQSHFPKKRSFQVRVKTPAICRNAFQRNMGLYSSPYTNRTSMLKSRVGLFSRSTSKIDQKSIKTRTDKRNR